MPERMCQIPLNCVEVIYLRIRFDISFLNCYKISKSNNTHLGTSFDTLRSFWVSLALSNPCTKQPAISHKKTTAYFFNYFGGRYGMGIWNFLKFTD